MATVERNIGQVLDLMLAIKDLPATVTNDLTDIATSLPYTAPEAFSILWGRMGAAVNAAVQQKEPHQLVGWEVELVELLIGRKLVDL